MAATITGGPLTSCVRKIYINWWAESSSSSSPKGLAFSPRNASTLGFFPLRFYQQWVENDPFPTPLTYCPYTEQTTRCEDQPHTHTHTPATHCVESGVSAQYDCSRNFDQFYKLISFRLTHNRIFFRLTHNRLVLASLTHKLATSG